MVEQPIRCEIHQYRFISTSAIVQHFNSKLRNVIAEASRILYVYVCFHCFVYTLVVPFLYRDRGVFACINCYPSA